MLRWKMPSCCIGSNWRRCSSCSRWRRNRRSSSSKRSGGGDGVRCSRRTCYGRFRIFPIFSWGDGEEIYSNDVLTAVISSIIQAGKDLQFGEKTARNKMKKYRWWGGKTSGFPGKCLGKRKVSLTRTQRKRDKEIETEKKDRQAHRESKYITQFPS